MFDFDEIDEALPYEGLPVQVGLGSAALSEARSEAGLEQIEGPAEATASPPSPAWARLKNCTQNPHRTPAWPEPEEHCQDANALPHWQRRFGEGLWQAAPLKAVP